MWIKAFCDMPFTRARVTCEGNVAMCCFMRPDPLKEERDAYLGNLLENTFDEIWFGEKAEAIRESTGNGELHPMCQCPGCPYTKMDHPYPKNKIIYNEYPYFLEIDLPNTHCNVGAGIPDADKNPACIMCERAAPWFRPEEDHLFDVLSKIKHIVPNLQQIHVQGLAEPFYIRKDSYMLFDVMDYLDFDKYKDKVTISVTTNATIFKKNIRQEYLERAPHSITNISLDAATPETYKNIRILDCFNNVLENLYAFSEERVRKRQFLRIHNNINTMNIHEVKEMVKIAAKANVEYVEFNPTDGFNHKILVNEKNCGRFAKAQEEIIELCEQLKVPYNFIRPLDNGLTNKLVQITL